MTTATAEAPTVQDTFRRASAIVHSWVSAPALVRRFVEDRVGAGTTADNLDARLRAASVYAHVVEQYPEDPAYAITPDELKWFQDHGYGHEKYAAGFVSSVSPIPVITEPEPVVTPAPKSKRKSPTRSTTLTAYKRGKELLAQNRATRPALAVEFWLEVCKRHGEMNDDLALRAYVVYAQLGENLVATTKNPSFAPTPADVAWFKAKADPAFVPAASAAVNPLDRVKIYGLGKFDDRFDWMKAAWEACAAAEVDLPAGVADYFGGLDPTAVTDRGINYAMAELTADNVIHFTVTPELEWVIKVDAIPAHVETIHVNLSALRPTH